MSKSPARRQIFLHGPIQGALISRIALYWLLSMFIQALLIMLLSVGSGSTDELFQRTHQFWWHLKLVAVSSLLTLPLLLLDITKLSHRWVGPIFRLRTAMQALAMGEDVQPLTFRTGDYWKDLSDDFNAVLTRVKHLDESCHGSGIRASTASELESEAALPRV
jgi:hypothetical protein